MPKADKLIMLILAVLLGLSVLVVLNTLNQKQGLETVNKTLQERAKQSENNQLKTIEEKRALEQEKINLESQLKEAQDAKVKAQKKLDEANEQLTQLNNKMEGFNSQISDLAGERDEWKKRLESIKKERDDSMTKLQEVAAQLAAKQAENQKLQEETKTTTAAANTTATAAAQPVTPSTPPAGAGDDQWAGLLKEKASLQVKLTELQNQLAANEIEISDFKKKNSDLELELTSLQNEKLDLERKLKFSEDLADNLSITLARTRNDRKLGDDQLEQLQQDNKDLRAQIKGLTSAKIALEKSIVHLTENKNAVEKKLDETESFIQGKVDELIQMKGQSEQKFQDTKSGSKEVELQPIIVSAAGPVVEQGLGGESQVAHPGPAGHIVKINGPNNFVIVDIGENSGLSIGDKLSAYRGSKYVAGLKIIQVRKEIAAADIMEKAAPVQVGDLVR